MSDSDRSARLAFGDLAGILVALVLSCLIVGIVAYSDGRQDEQQHQQTIAAREGRTGHQQRPQQADTDHAGVPAFAERFISNPEPDEGTEREKRDLAAQENTAAWAFWIVLFTGGQLVLSGFGLAALLITIRQGREGLDRAREALDADKFGQRAWMALEQIIENTVDDGRFPDGSPAKGMLFRIRWKNSGLTPALETRVNFRMQRVVPGEAPLEFPPIVIDGGATSAGPGMGVVSIERALAGKIYEDFVSGRTDIVLYSRIEYRDIFHPNELRHTEICYRARANGTVVVEGREAPNISYISVGKQNTMS